MRLQAHMYSAGMADGSTSLGLGHHFRGADFWLIFVLLVGLAHVTLFAYPQSLIAGRCFHAMMNMTGSNFHL